MAVRTFITKRISDLLALAQTIMSAFLNDPLTYPNAPEDGKHLGVMIDDVTKLLDEMLIIKGKLTEKSEQLKEAVENLNDGVTKDREYIRYIGSKNPAIYTTTGLKPNRVKKEPRVPGQCRNFKIVSQDETSFKTEWNFPVRGSGGGIRFSQILGRVKGAAQFIIMAASTSNKAVIPNQAEGTIYEFCVVAYNKVGAGLESNTLTIKF